MEKMVTHHTSYIPEKTELIPLIVHQRIPKRPLTSRNLFLLATRIFPSSHMAHIPRDVRNEIGPEVEICTGPRLAVLFPFGANLEDVERSLKIVLEDVKFRRKMQEDKENKLATK